MVTRWLVFHVASGQAFFTGAALLVLAAWLSVRGTNRFLRTARNLAVCLGALLVALSATPLAPWFSILLLLLLLLWLVGEAIGKRLPPRILVGLRFATTIAWLSAMLAELPYHLMPDVPRLGSPILGIIGDSISAGMGQKNVVTWPVLFAETYGVAVRDHSRIGATVGSALRQAGDLTAEERLVLLEIGGNDFFGETRPREFASGLSRLLATVCRPGRVVVMLELPLPPAFNEYGRIQRRLAREYRVILIPKRVMLGVLEREGATVDSVHLSQQGHRWMAETMWGVVRGAYAGRDRTSGGGGDSRPEPFGLPPRPGRLEADGQVFDRSNTVFPFASITAMCWTFLGLTVTVVSPVPVRYISLPPVVRT
jgi:acyl-CoA thioesterase-1